MNSLSEEKKSYEWVVGILVLSLVALSAYLLYLGLGYIYRWNGLSYSDFNNVIVAFLTCVFFLCLIALVQRRRGV
ncbi:MAG: hypothetical protein B6U69_03945 [Thermofilum sp. ex4484_15]|nr:MAG: hypothetical protein B6U69_03945 [Thermofilum sp. ex4484_15]